jgi:hypothetical protein
VLSFATAIIAAIPQTAFAQTKAQSTGANATPTPFVLSEEQNRIEDQVREPYRIAAAIVAADRPEPKFIANIGAFQGQFLAAFLDQFPHARGEYAEPDTSSNPPVAKQRLAKYGDRVSFVVGCASRDVSEGCVPKDADVIITEWLSIHQNLDGMYKVYRAAANQLPSGGWFVNLDHVTFGGTAWEGWLNTAAKSFRPEAEGPKLHHADYRVPTLEEQLGAMRAAGFDAQVVWQAFNTVLIMGRKH